MDGLSVSAARSASVRRVRPTPVPPRPVVRRFTSAQQMKPGQVVFDRVKRLPCMVISARGSVVRVVRPGGSPWAVDLVMLSPGSPYHCRQLDALAQHVSTQRKGLPQVGEERRS